MLTALAAHENGMPVMTGGSVSFATAWFRYYAGWADKVGGEFGDAAGGMNYIRYEPYGVVGAIIPWNAPLMSIAMKALAALAAGNAVVVKPPMLTPFTALRAAELAMEAGFPSGVFNVVPGDAEAGEALIVHRDVSKISFTGGAAIARRVLETAARHLKPVTLELGGKSANLIFEDADLEKASTMAAFHGTVVLSGQACVLPTRALVHERVYDEVVARISGTMAHVTVGDPMQPATMMGPVVSDGACRRILGVIDTARTSGAGRVVTGGERLGGDLAGGYFIAPTVFADVDRASPLARDEIFGPVLSILKFSSDEEAVALANDSDYGLGAYVHTRDLRRAHKLAASLQSGSVAVNSAIPMHPDMPFGGVKQSGFGREGGRAGLDEFLQPKNVFVSLD